MAANNHSAELNNVKEKMLPTGDSKSEGFAEGVDYKDHPLTEDTTCGIGFLKSRWLQKCANKKAYVFLYGLLGCIYSASYAYFNGTITTLEKRFKIPSRTTGIITVGNDISQLFVSIVISYYAGKGHRPRWMALGIYTVVLFCLMTALPHLLYGPGEDALALTFEYGGNVDQNATLDVINREKSKTLCKEVGAVGAECEKEDGSIAPQVILFMANFVAGIGGSLYYTLGVSYMDDNIKKSKTPVLISISYFLRMLGPAIGYALASLCLKFYISPTLTPTINLEDPRWLGAWWMGWVILSVLLFLCASMLALFPKTLPRAAARKMVAMEKIKGETVTLQGESDLPASFFDMMKTFRRLVTNPTLMCNNLAAVFYFMGYMPYWIFMPKYIETQYKQSASISNLITGTVGLVFSAFGILLSGIVLSRLKPRARYMAAWNVLVGVISVLGIISYAFLGCSAINNYKVDTSFSCNQDCSCDYVKYSPVCSSDGSTTYISACHAGCKQQLINSEGKKLFTDCKCIKSSPLDSGTADHWVSQLNVSDSTASPYTASPIYGGTALPGSCSVDCSTKFYMFLAVVCLLKFSGATGRATNFLVSVRCVVEKDKPVSMAFSLTLMSLFAFVPSPIFFGFILDKTCLFWGKTCSGNGNCWLYDGESLRYLLNFIAAGFVSIGTLFDIGVWYYVKNLNIFDEELELKTMDETKEKIIIED